MEPNLHGKYTVPYYTDSIANSNDSFGDLNGSKTELADYLSAFLITHTHTHTHTHIYIYIYIYGNK